MNARTDQRLPPAIKKTPEVHFLRGSIPLVRPPSTSSRSSPVRSRRTVSSGKGLLLTRCQVTNDSKGHHQDDTCVPDRRRRRHSHQHTPMKKGAFIAPFARTKWGIALHSSIRSYRGLNSFYDCLYAMSMGRPPKH